MNKNINKKVIFPVILAVIFSALETVKCIQFVKAENTIKHVQATANSPIKSDKQKTIQIKRKLFSKQDEVIAKTPFKINYPKKIDGLKLSSTKLDQHSYKNAPINVVTLVYTGDNNKQLVVQQVDTNIKPDIISDSDPKVKLSNGIEDIILSEENNYLQIIFQKDNRYYTVCGDNLGKDRLLVIASTL